MNGHSLLGAVIARYLQLKQALGRSYRAERAVLESLDRFLVAGRATRDLTLALFSEWCKTQRSLTSNVQRRRMMIVHNFCLYRQRTEPDCFVPDPRLFPRERPRKPPYIFKEVEIARLIRAAGALKPIPRSPLRPQVMRLAIALLYTSGLRRGELIRLTVGDYDARNRTLLIRESKFHKSRYVPLSLDAAQEVEAYLSARRRRHLPMAADKPLIWNGYGISRAYSGGGLAQALRALFRSVDIKTQDGRPPRVHDVRHTFAVHALLRWYRIGADPQAKLPLLATYMGHVSITSTEYYLPLIEDLASAASDKFAAYCGSFVTAIPETEGGAR
ncbi:MAG: tyrosine-type recombinase/integrase [Chloroflexi bacterium]|nr:tyrosine-type recombinase/integrase [Chloroflexota bacterium]